MTLPPQENMPVTPMIRVHGTQHLVFQLSHFNAAIFRADNICNCRVFVFIEFRVPSQNFEFRVNILSFESKVRVKISHFQVKISHYRVRNSHFRVKM